MKRNLNRWFGLVWHRWFQRGCLIVHISLKVSVKEFLVYFLKTCLTKISDPYRSVYQWEMPIQTCLCQSKSTHLWRIPEGVLSWWRWGYVLCHLGLSYLTSVVIFSTFWISELLAWLQLEIHNWLPLLVFKPFIIYFAVQQETHYSMPIFCCHGRMW
jgi:hypothetical protein